MRSMQDDHKEQGAAILTDACYLIVFILSFFGDRIFITFKLK